MRLFQKRQGGYFAIVLAMLIVTVAFTSLVISYGIANKAMSITNSLLSMQAYYMAESGLERATYDLTRYSLSPNYLTCNSITGTNYTNATFPNAPGQFTVTSVRSQAWTTLSSAITATSNLSLPVLDSSDFASSGTIRIDQELINYNFNSAGTLSGMARGIGGTTPAAHSAGAFVSQEQCMLTAIGAVPTISNPIAMRTLNKTLIGASFSLGQTATGAGAGGDSSMGAGSRIYQSSSVSVNTYRMRTTTRIINPSVLNSTTFGNLSGANIMSRAAITIDAGNATYVANSFGNSVISSQNGSFQSDVIQNATSTTGVPLAANLFTRYFPAAQATVKSTAVVRTGATILGRTGEFAWITGNTTINTTTAIGSDSAPILLVVEGNLTLSGNADISFNGVVYVTGNLVMNNNSTNVAVNGAVIVGGTVDIRGETLTNFIYNPATVAGAASLSTTYRPIVSYSIVGSNWQEIFL